MEGQTVRDIQAQSHKYKPKHLILSRSLWL